MTGRPTTKRRLRDIDPDVFGRDVAERVATHALFLLDPRDQNAELARVVEHSVVEIAKEAVLLAQYARDGVIDRDRAAGALTAVQAWLYTCAIHGSHAVIAKLDIVPDDDIGVVLLAAHARICLGYDEAVPVRELACLAGVDPDHVRLLARQGQILRISGGVVTAQIAQQWLVSRGIVLPS